MYMRTCDNTLRYCEQAGVSFAKINIEPIHITAIFATVAETDTQSYQCLRVKMMTNP